MREPRFLEYWAERCCKQGWNLHDSCLPKSQVVWDALGCVCVGVAGGVKWVSPNHWTLLQDLVLHKIIWLAFFFFFFVVKDIAKKKNPSYIYEAAVCDSVILTYSVWLLVWWEEVLRMWQNRKHEKEPGCVWPSPAGGGADAAPTAGCAETCWTTGISRSLLTLFHCCSQP